MNRWLWRGGVGLLILILTTGLTLVVALLLGLNSPRPIHSPDWQAADLPTTLEATPNATTENLLGQSYDDFTLEVEAVPLSGPDSGFNGYGLVYRAQDDAHYYAFAVGSDGYYAILRVDGDEETSLVDWQQFPHVRRDKQTNRLRVDCTGADCRFYINDEYATAVEDATWLEGDVGLWVRSFEEEPVSVQFEGVRVWTERVFVQALPLRYNHLGKARQGMALGGTLCRTKTRPRNSSSKSWPTCTSALPDSRDSVATWMLSPTPWHTISSARYPSSSAIPIC